MVLVSHGAGALEGSAEGGRQIDPLWCNVRGNSNRRVKMVLVTIYEGDTRESEAAVTRMWYDE